MALADIFKSYDIRGKVGTQLSPEFTKKIAVAYADWLPQKGIVAVGRDMRPDSQELANAFIDGLRAQGRDVWDIGQVTSDMIYFAVGKWDLAGGAVITASHNASDENGIKLYRDKVTAVGLDSGLAQIRDKVLASDFMPNSKTLGSVTTKTITSEWVAHCLTFIDTLKPFNIAIDAGNGMAGAILPHILPKLPITAEAMYFDLDGTFPNHEANPQKMENLQDLMDKVTDKNYDFGIAFDGDGDRAVFVDDKARPVLGTDLMSIVAKLYLDKYSGSKIVHDVRTSRATQELITEWGGVPVRSKAGRVNVGSLMRQVGGVFGGETTGHFFYKENYDADSGLIVALTAMQAITNSGKKLSELVDEYRRYAMIPETNFETTKKDAVFEKLKQQYNGGEQDMLDGLTVSYPDFWFNMRASNTEPVMRLNAEAKTQQQLNELVERVTTIINSVK
ncbi:MAG: phosphomannomutase/phosphoglucomutase [bacterium]